MATLNSNIVSITQLRANFLKLVKKYHPDLHPEIPDIAEKFIEVVTEYQKCIDLLSKNKKIYSIRVSISLQDAILGCDRFFISTDDKRKFLLKIPAGVKDGDCIRYKNVQMHESFFSILEVKININFPINYTYKNNKLLLKVYVHPWKLYFGGRIVIFGPDGSRLNICLPVKTKSGAIFEMKNEGMLDRVSKQRNMLYLQIISKIFIDRNFR